MLTDDPKARKDIPLYRGLLKYFPDALCAVAELSRIGSEQHFPGQPMHWGKSKSADHGDCLLRHQIDAGTVDTDKVRHSTKVAWRALAQLQIELEKAAAKPAENMTATEVRARQAEADKRLYARPFFGHFDFKAQIESAYEAACKAGMIERRERQRRVTPFTLNLSNITHGRAYKLCPLGDPWAWKERHKAVITEPCHDFGVTDAV